MNMSSAHFNLPKPGATEQNKIRDSLTGIRYKNLRFYWNINYDRLLHQKGNP